MPKTAEKSEETQEALPRTEEPPDPEPALEASTEETTAPVERLSPEDLGGDRDFEETTLPNMGKRVNVRYLATDEALALKRLPDLLGFTELAEQYQSEDEQEREAVDLDELESQGIRYNAVVAHRAIMANRSMKVLKCESCGKHHPRSLLTFRQALRLHPADLNHVVLIALGPWQVGVVPFSEAPTHPDTPVPASSSE